MFDGVVEFVEMAFAGPVWPATLAILILLAYSVLVLLGLVDADMEGPELDAGGDGAGDVLDSASSLGAATIHWLNLDRVPLFLWIGLFGFCWWIVSLGLWGGFDRYRYEPVLLTSLLLAGRNIVVAVGLTKLGTEPMKRWFEKASPYRPETIVGDYCEIATGEATIEFGRAKFKTDGAPLLLNVRTLGETLRKGQRVQIVGFDPQTRIYTVQSTEAQK